jgi:hypothetical protein
VVDRHLPSMLRRIQMSYARGTDDADAPGAPDAASDFSTADRAWGLMPLRDYAEAVHETMERDYAPRFAELGIRFPG